MQLFVFLSTVILQLYTAFASPTNENDRLIRAATVMAAPSQNYIRGYECGNTFFTDDEVKRYFSMFFKPSNPYPPNVYHGPLYGDAEITEYFLWPIKKGMTRYPNPKYSFSAFYIVSKRKENELVDVISRISTHHFTKCIKRDNSRSEPSNSISEGTYDYYCGHVLVSDEEIQNSVGLARQNIGKNLLYPASYVGKLYPKDSGYMIHPIMLGKRVCDMKNNAGPYFIVMNGQLGFVDVVVRGPSKNLLRCIRSRKLPDVLTPDLSISLSVRPLKRGFQCGKIFFDDENLQQAAKVAQSVGPFKEYGHPKKYKGNQFNEPCLLWPIIRNGRFFRNGPPGPYRVVLTLNYKVIAVGIYENDSKVKLCDRRIIQEEKDHDTSDYLCGTEVFARERLIRAVEKACEALNYRSHKLYPAKYEGPRFEKDGPYFTYPIFLDTEYKRKEGKHRVVMNQECELVGAITTVQYFSQKILIKCHRIKDGPIPKQPYFDPKEPILERWIVHHRSK